ncbi:hypothetical protein NQZ68_022648 [Dissostichus eleginoides]|nr:hypothetical protein NQZ68_022648 [Dissostichus eleginoides]
MWALLLYRHPLFFNKMRSGGMTMQIVYLWSTFTFLLQKHCSAEELPCTVEELNGWTKYNVPKNNAAGCICYWTDPKGNNLKTHDSVNEMKEQSEWTFHSEVCYNQLNVSCTCLSETEHITATCTADCSRKEKGVGDRQEMENDPTKSVNDNVTPRLHWMTMVFGIIVILVLLPLP